jgi:MAP/microtubule affinity-regulating kinase
MSACSSPRKTGVDHDQRFEKQEQLPGLAVWAARDMHNGGAMVAVKHLDRGRCEENGRALPLIEVSLGTTLQHSNVVRIFEVIQQPDRVVLVQELLTGGDLFSCLQQFEVFSELVARCCFSDLVGGLEYLHVNGVVHRDLKPENCVFDHNGTLKIVDFGLAARFVPGQLLEQYCGSLEFAAPEVLRTRPHLGPPIDVWAVGVMLYDMVLGDLPFVVGEEVFELPASLENEVSSELALLLLGVLEQDPDLRLTVSAIKSSNWMALPLDFEGQQDGLVNGTVGPETLPAYSPLYQRVQRERQSAIRRDMGFDFDGKTNDDPTEVVFLSVRV